MASPSASRTIGHTTISTAKFKSRTMRRIIATCAASFCPKNAASGSTMLNSFATTVATPRKCPAREPPSNLSLSPSTVTQVVVGRTLLSAALPYISSTLGANNNSTPSRSNNSQSHSNVRGYFPRSSFAPNCVGFTKIEAATTSDPSRAARTNDKCPSCSAPIVGTNPTRFPASRKPREALRIS